MRVLRKCSFHLLALVFLTAFLSAHATTVAPGEELISTLLARGIAQPRIALGRGSEGEGPFKRLVIRDVTVIDGTGAAAYGPATVVIEQDRIAKILKRKASESDLSAA